MDEQRAQRTLVKSPPELWAEISDVDALARHLGEFGEISITRSEPETAVAWEGDRARGTVELEPAGWGTKVTLTAVPVGRLAAAAEPVGAEPQRGRAEPRRAARSPPPQPPPAREPAAPEPAGPEAEPRPEGEAAVDADDAPAGRPRRRRPRSPAAACGPASWPSGAGRRRTSRLTAPTRARRPTTTTRPARRRRPARGRRRRPPRPRPRAGPGRSPPAAPARAARAAPRAGPAPVTPAAGAADPARTAAILVEVLDDLGAARHRPFSRMS